MSRASADWRKIGARQVYRTHPAILANLPVSTCCSSLSATASSAQLDCGQLVRRLSSNSTAAAAVVSNEANVSHNDNKQPRPHLSINSIANEQLQQQQQQQRRKQDKHNHNHQAEWAADSKRPPSANGTAKLLPLSGSGGGGSAATEAAAQRYLFAAGDAIGQRILLDQLDELADEYLSENDKLNLSYFLNEFETNSCDLSELLANLLQHLLVKLPTPMVKYQLLTLIKQLYVDWSSAVNQSSSGGGSGNGSKHQLDVRLFEAMTRRYLMASNSLMSDKSQQQQQQQWEQSQSIKVDLSLRNSLNSSAPQLTAAAQISPPRSSNQQQQQQRLLSFDTNNFRGQPDVPDSNSSCAVLAIGNNTSQQQQQQQLNYAHLQPMASNSLPPPDQVNRRWSEVSTNRLASSLDSLGASWPVRSEHYQCFGNNDNGYWQMLTSTNNNGTTNSSHQQEYPPLSLQRQPQLTTIANNNNNNDWSSATVSSSTLDAVGSYSASLCENYHRRSLNVSSRQDSSYEETALSSWPQLASGVYATLDDSIAPLLSEADETTNEEEVEFGGLVEQQRGLTSSCLFSENSPLLLTTNVSQPYDSNSTTTAPMVVAQNSRALPLQMSEPLWQDSSTRCDPNCWPPRRRPSDVTDSLVVARTTWPAPTRSLFHQHHQPQLAPSMQQQQQQQQQLTRLALPQQTAPSGCAAESCLDCGTATRIVPRESQCHERCCSSNNAINALPLHPNRTCASIGTAPLVDNRLATPLPTSQVHQVQQQHRSRRQRQQQQQHRLHINQSPHHNQQPIQSKGTAATTPSRNSRRRRHSVADSNSDSGLSITTSTTNTRAKQVAHQLPDLVAEQMKEQASSFVAHHYDQRRRRSRGRKQKAELQVRRTLRVKIRKSKPILGIAIEGGYNLVGHYDVDRHHDELASCRNFNLAHIHQEDGAAYQCGKLRASDLILEVNGTPTVNMTHDEIAKTIASAYYDDVRSHIEFLIGESVNI